jgi:hypothetical protein
MDGNSLIDKLAILLQESVNTSSFLDSRSTYDFLYEAAQEVARRTNALTGSTTITTVANQTTYSLPVDFLRLFTVDSFNNPVVKYNDGNSDTWIRFRDYGAVLFGDQSVSVPIPSSFSLIDQAALASPIVGTATAPGASSGGESTLTDSTAPFAGASVGDEVHNTTDGSSGVVVAVTSTSALVTALFGGTNNDWTSADAYVIVPQGRLQMVLDPPPSTSGNTITVQYYAKPAPVYSLYRAYRFPATFESPIVKYAAWLYKYRDRDPSFGDAFYRHFELECRKLVRESDSNKNRYSMRVNFNRRSLGDRSYR